MTTTTEPSDECTRFRDTIISYLQRQRKRLEKKHGNLPKSYKLSYRESLSITDHATHVLKTLCTKRESLSNAILAFEHLCRDCVDAVKQVCDICTLRTNIQEILTHFFVQYIHLRDGFVLLTSGECRHEADSKSAKSEERYFSKLNSLSKRKDGYTSLFRSNCGYSGYGWDEFHNEEVGIRRRLLDALRKCSMYPREMTPEMEEKILYGESAFRARENLWEKLVESGAEIFESAFDGHENDMKELQRQLEGIRAQFISSMDKILTSRGSGRLIMATEDKFERLELKNASSIGLSTLCIQRQGDAFRGRDKRGALPSNFSIDDWVIMMSLPVHLKYVKSRGGRKVTSSDSSTKPSSLKRKRVVIMDSDDEEDGDRPNKDVNRSLKVTVKKAQKKDFVSSSSIHSIKKDLGVNVDELERRREDIEAEEQVTKEAAYIDEVGELFQSSRNHSNLVSYTEEVAALHESILDTEESLHMIRSVCKRKNREDDEAWDSRESLRFSLMTLGNLLLEYHSLNPKNQDYSLLKKAEAHFEEAKATVQELEILNKFEIDDEQEYKFRQRALLLCRGRANTNLGKTYFEQSEMIRRRNGGVGFDQREQLQKLARAIKFLKNAEKDAKCLHAQAVANDYLDKRAHLHRIDANLLLSLTLRFQGYVFLRLSKEQECIKQLRKSAGIDSSGVVVIEETIDKDCELFEAKVWLLLEQYDGAWSLIQTIPFLHNLAFRTNSNQTWDDEMLKILDEAFDQTTKMSEILGNLQTHNATIKEIVSTHGIHRIDEITRLRNETMKRHRDRKIAGHELSMNTKKTPAQSLRRNDLLRNSITFESRPTGRIVIDGATRKKNDQTFDINPKKEAQVSGNSFDNFCLESNSESVPISLFDESATFSSKRYRKWGDDIFEEGINIDAYPSLEPERPKEMIQELKELGIFE